MAKYKITNQRGETYLITSPKELSTEELTSYAENPTISQEPEPFEPETPDWAKPEEPKKENPIIGSFKNYGERLNKNIDEIAQKGVQSQNRDKSGFNSVLSNIAGGLESMVAIPANLPGVYEGSELAGRAFVKLMPGTAEALGWTAKQAEKLPEPVKNLASIGSSAATLYGTAPAVSFVKKVGPEVAKKTIGGISKGTGAIVKGVETVAEKTPGLKNIIAADAARALEKSIDETAFKSLQPGLKGKKTLAQQMQFKKDVGSAAQTIVEETGKTPTSILELQEALPEAKKVVYEKFNTMSKGSTVAFDESPVVRYLEAIANDPAETDAAAFAAKKLIPEIERMKGMSPEQVEKKLAGFNNQLQDAYANANASDPERIKKTATLLIREQLDDNITKAMGSGYQELKNKYGALKSIENDVNRVALAERKRTVGKDRGLLSQILNAEAIYVAAQATAEALLTHGASLPTTAMRLGATLGTKAVINNAKNPNKPIQRLFKQTAKKSLKEIAERK